MSFIQRELERLGRELVSGEEGPRHRQLFAAQLALSWAIDPTRFTSPADYLTAGRTVASAGCLGESHLRSS